jgi:hypothetical protein
MVYYKVILDDRTPKEDEVYPVIILVTYNRTNTSLSIGVNYVIKYGIKRLLKTQVFSDNWSLFEVLMLKLAIY